jgi:hypothetical protein
LGEVVPKADEAVGPASEELAVDPHLAVHVHAIELDDDLPAGDRRKREAFPIPADAMGEEAAVVLARRRLVNGHFNAPVVRHVERAPAGVIKARLPGGRVIPEPEAPTGVERDDLSRAGRRLGSRQGGGSGAEQSAEIEGVEERGE